jgi:hypothetical protein
MEESRSLMLLDVRTDKLTMRNFEPEPSSYMAESMMIERKDENGNECHEEEKPKVPNEKDETLRVSLIASKWVCC